MNDRPESRSVTADLRNAPLQLLAILFCCLFGIAIILNVEMGGEATWFWYATLFHSGVKLYRDLHFALQPLFVIETDWWMLLVGKRLIPYETLALLHVLILCFGMFLIQRESQWPDWQKAITIAGTFFVIIYFLAYRFDDFHIVADIFVVYSIAVALILSRTESPSRLLLMSGTLGILAGLATMNRITDGGALLVATGVSVPFLARKRKFSATAIYAACAVLIIAAVILWTGDTFHDYVYSSILKAAGAKGGTGSILHAPIVALLDNIKRSRSIRGIAWMLAIASLGGLAHRYWKKGTAGIVLIELTAATLSYGLVPPLRSYFLGGGPNLSLSTFLQPLTYLLCLVAAFRYLRARFGAGDPATGRKPWDNREAVILIPVATLLSAAASQGNGTYNSFITMAMLFLLVPVFQPFGKYSTWANPSFVVIVLIVGLSGMADKIRFPYSWNSYSYGPMFEDRHWYRHPVYGPMYLDSNTRNFIVPVCDEIARNDPQSELLSMPYSYPNYFCAITPWHGYVQTWFDTATPQTIARLMQELDTAPPQWIIYQRQISVLSYHELEYNHNQPIAHRFLDEMIMKKIASGQWQLIEKRAYLKDDGWFIIRTRP
jgi:hypothetical protein